MTGYLYRWQLEQRRRKKWRAAIHYRAWLRASAVREADFLLRRRATRSMRRIREALVRCV